MDKDFKLKIACCPYCGYDGIVKEEYYKETIILCFDYEGNCFESNRGDFAKEYKKPSKLRCLNCEKSLERWVVYT